MYCRKCGTPLADDATFCPNCGEMRNPTNGNANPLVQTTSMKWFKFLINFSLFCGAVLNAIAGVSFLTGAYYGGDADLVYSAFESLKTVDVIMGILSFALTALGVYTRVRLAGYHRNGPKMLTYLYLANAAINIIYAIGLSMALPSDIVASVMDSSTYSSIITSVIMVFINRSYFKKRSHLFFN